MIEYASGPRGHASWRHAPPHIQAKLEAGYRAGPPPAEPGLPSARQLWRDQEAEPTEPIGRIVWDPDSKDPMRPGALMTRVFCVVAHGDARAEHIGMPRSETVTRNAFGSAAELNSEVGWALTMRHQGPVLTFNGKRRGLVAHDSEIGIILEWSPRLEDPAHRDAVERIERDGWGCSVLYQYSPRNITETPGLGIVRRGRLLHVAIVERPAYPGAVAMVFRDSRRGDRDQLRAQLDRVVREAKFRYRRSRGWV